LRAASPLLGELFISMGIKAIEFNSNANQQIKILGLDNIKMILNDKVTINKTKVGEVMRKLTLLFFAISN